MKLNTKLLTPNDRANYAQLIANMLNMPQYNFKAYRPNDWDFSYWTVDENNNWKIQFYEDDTLEIIHRRSSRDEKIEGQIKILASWLVARFGFSYAN
jgi:hypothetical protein